MDITSIILTPEQISGNATGTGILLQVIPVYTFVNGKKTDIIEGYSYLTAFPDNAFDKAKIKVKDGKPVITNEQLLAKGGKVKVAFKNLKGKFYRTPNGEYALTANAEGLEVIQ